MYKSETFESLIAPLSLAEFYESYWAKTFLYQQNEPGRFSRYFSSAAIDQWLATTRSGPGNSIMVVNNNEGEITRSDYRPEDAEPSLIYEAVAKKSSVVLNHLSNFPPLEGLTKALSKEFEADVGINAYLTPTSAKTFNIHTDNHDVLILHLEGEKIWHLHELSLSQLELKQKKNLRFPEEWYGRNETPELAEIRLTPGDLLYIPRGMPHYAEATGSTTLHLTISITPLYWMDFIKIAAEHVAAHSAAAREAFLPGFASNDALYEQMRGQYEKVMAAFQEHVTFDNVMSVVKRNRVFFQGFPADGHVHQLLNIDQLSVDSLVEKRRDILCTVDEVLEPDRSVKSAIFFGYKRITGPLHLRRGYEFIRSCTRPFKVSEIPGLDEKGQKVIARRLIQEGLLCFVSIGEEETTAVTEEPVLAGHS